MIDNLSPMVDQALARWPAIAYRGKRGNRAQSAAQLVRDGQVRHLGGDAWEVGNHQCTPTTCDCEDRAPLDERGGKLCKHCIAVRMTIRVQDNAALLERLQQLGGGAERVALLVDRDYQRRDRQLVGYRQAGRDLRWAPAERLTVTYEQMARALALLGWSVAELPRKWGRFEYVVTLRTDGQGAPLTAPIWDLRGVTDAMLERRANERLAGWAVGEFAAVA